MLSHADAKLHHTSFLTKKSVGKGKPPPCPREGQNTASSEQFCCAFLCGPVPNLALQCVTSQASHVLSSTRSGRPNHCQPPCLLHHSCLQPLHPLQVPCIYTQAAACHLSEYEFSVAESATLLASLNDHGWGSPFKPCCGQSGLCSDDCRWSWLLVASAGATVQSIQYGGETPLCKGWLLVIVFAFGVGNLHNCVSGSPLCVSEALHNCSATTACDIQKLFFSRNAVMAKVESALSRAPKSLKPQKYAFF